MNNFKKQFEEFERKNKLGNFYISGYPIWEIVRFFIFQDILIQKKVVKQAIYPKKDFFYILKKTLKIFKNILNLIFLCFTKNKNIDIFILGHPRRQKQKDGKYYDIYTDFLKQELKNKNISYISFEETYFDFFDNIPDFSKKLYRLDLIYLIYLTKVKFFKLDKKDFSRIKKIEKELNNSFGVNIDLVNKIKKDLLLFLLLEKFYNKLLKKLNVKKIVEVVGFSIWAKALNYSAKNLNIKTYELQHGTILNNFACDLQNIFSGDTLPDFLLTYGKFWNSVIEFPQKQKVIEVGFPYFENLLKNKNSSLDNKKNILIISQGNISEKLSFFTKKLALKYKNYHFFYKLHPGEFSNDKMIKQNLTGLNNVEIVYDKYNIYELFEQVKNCIGVSSTSLYEGFLFGNNIFILPLNDGYKIFDYFLEKKYFNLINLDDLKLDFQEKNNNINYDYFLEKKSLNNILKLITK